MHAHGQGKTVRRWLFLWGPPLFALALSAGSCMTAAAVVEAGHSIASVPFWVTMTVSFFVALTDILPDSWGDRRKRRLVAYPCKACVLIDRKLASVTKDRDELREALAVLRLPESP